MIVDLLMSAPMKHIPIRSIHTLHNEPAFSENFRIRDLQHLLAGKQMIQEPHRHDFFYILALHKGTGRHIIDFNPYPVGNRSVFFLRPGQVHQLTLGSGSTGYLLQFKPGFYYPHDKASNQLLRKAGMTNHYQPDAGNFSQVFTLFTNIYREYTGKQEGFQEIIKANLSILFIQLLRQNKKDQSDHATPYAQERLEALTALIETHIAQKKQVSQYADLLHLSPYQLNAITKATLGKTCSTLINEQIILESKRYLLATTSQVNQVADYLGFEDVSYFIRFFKKHTGYSPDAFRQHFR